MKQEDNNFITLNNGVQIPKIGFGVFRITDEKNVKILLYRLCKQDID